MTDSVKVDKKKYVGVWHEIASLPAWFQKNCEDTTAEYTDKGEFIEVRNSCNISKTKCDKTSCRKVKMLKIKIGKAFVTNQPDTLKVQFFPPIKAPYKVEHLDIDEKGDYQNAIVGSGKKYLWFLSRNEQISNDKFNELLKIAESKGYDTKKLNKTIH